MNVDVKKLQDLLGKKLVTWTINNLVDKIVLTFEGGLALEVSSPDCISVFLLRPVREEVC